MVARTHKVDVVREKHENKNDKNADGELFRTRINHSRLYSKSLLNLPSSESDFQVLHGVCAWQFIQLFGNCHDYAQANTLASQVTRALTRRRANAAGSNIALASSFMSEHYYRLGSETSSLSSNAAGVTDSEPSAREHLPDY